MKQPSRVVLACLQIITGVGSPQAATLACESPESLCSNACYLLQVAALACRSWCGV